MSLTVTFNGSNYTIPQPNEVGWGTALDNYLVAIAAGCLQKTGGSFTLSAETDFGSSFGLKSLYYKSRGSNVSSTGVVRLNNNSDTVSWRNAANGGDLALKVNASDQLTFNGTPVALSSLTSAHIFVGSAGGVATDVAMTGDISIDNTGLTAIGSGKIVNAQVSASAAIAYSKLSLTGSIVNADISASAAIAIAKLAPLSFSLAVSTSAGGVLTTGTTTAAELEFVHGVTSAIQTQLDAKMPKAGSTFTGDVTFASGKGMFWTDSGTNTVKLTAPTTITPSSYTLKWPAAQGGSNQYLTNDGSGNLSWTNAAGTGTVNSGTQYQLAYYATTTNTVSGLTLITGSRALASDANGLPVAATTTAAELNFVNGVTSAIQTQINTKAPTASPTFTGAVTMPTPFTLGAVSVTATGTEMNYLVGVTSAIQTQLGTKSPIASPTFTGTLKTPILTVTDAGSLTTSRFISFAMQSVDVSTDTYTIGGIPGATLAASKFYISHDPALGNNGLFDLNGAKSNYISIGVSVTTPVQIRGTATNDDATAGCVGEAVRSNVAGGSAVSSTGTGQWFDVTSIALTAGDWDVTGVLTFIPNGATVSGNTIGVSVTSGNSSTGLTNGDNQIEVLPTTTAASSSAFVPAYRLSLSASATAYLKANLSFSVATPKAFGRISARRVR